MTHPTIRPVPPDSPVAGREDSAVVQGLDKTTTSSTGKDEYKTEFVKIYQDAGVIGASMLTLLVLCFLLGMFSLRLLKMYVVMTESRDKLDEARSSFSERLVERLFSLEAKVGTVLTELRSDHNAQTTQLNRLIEGQNRFDGRMDSMQDREAQRDRRTRRDDTDAREARSEIRKP